MKNIRMRKNIKYIVTQLLVGVTLSVSGGNAASEHLVRGFELIDMGRWADARVELLSAKSNWGDMESLERQRVDYGLALCGVQLEQQGCDEAVSSFIKSYPQAPYRDYMLFLRGLVLAADGDNKAALDLFGEVESSRLSESDHERYNIRMGYLLFMEQRYDEAMKYLQLVKEQSEYYPHAVYCMSYINYLDGNYNAARSGFESLKGDESFAPIAPYYLMQIEFLTAYYKRAIEYGNEILEGSLAQKQVDVVRTLAEAHFRLEEYNESLSLIDRYAEAGGELGREENYIKGFSLHQLGWYAEAIESLKRVCGADDEMTQNASFHLANCYIHTGNKSGAKRAFSMAANDKFNRQIAEEALFNYAKLQYELGDGLFNESVNLLTRYVTTYDNPERLTTARTLLVAAYYNTRDYATAYENIKLIQDPDAEIKAAKQKITYLRGLERYNTKDYDGASMYLGESIKIGVTAKQIALASYWIGEIDYLQGRYDEAIKRYNYYVARAPKSDPTSVEVQYSLAYALLMQGNGRSALDYFKRYVSSPAAVAELRADAYSRMGDIYYTSRSFTEAANCYNKSVAIGGAGSNYARYQVAIIKGIQSDPQAKILELMGITSAELGEEYLDDAKYELGRSYIGVEQYRDAITSHLQFIEQYPASPLYAQALSDLGVAYFNVGDKSGALDYYDRAIKAAPQSQIAKDAMQGVREIHIGAGDAESYFKYAESIGMEGDLNAVTRDSLSFASARGLYFAGDKSKSKLRDAAVALESYVEGYPKGYYLNDALFFLSDSYIKMGDSTKAINTLERLGDRGRSQYSESLYSKLSVICFEQGEYAKSAKASRALYDVTKSRATQHEAMLRYIDAAVMSGDREVVAKACDEILAMGEKGAGRGAMTKASYSRATELRESGKRREALKIYVALADGKSEYHSEARYYIIEDRYRAGERETAKDMIFDFSDEAETDPYWLAKSFILLGDIYVAEEDNFQARATYQSIVDGYTNQSDGVVEEAKGKIGELK